MMTNYSDRELQNEIEILLDSGELNFDQIDHLLYLETVLCDGTITEEEKMRIITRNL